MPEIITKKFRILMIEDSQERIDKIRSWLPESYVLMTATSAGKAIGVLQRDKGSVYGALMLDHDLNEQAATTTDLTLSGTDIVKNIMAHLSLDVPILVHSMNPSRAPAMAKKLTLAKFDVTSIPFEGLKKDVFLEWVNEAYLDWAYINDLN